MLTDSSVELLLLLSQIAATNIKQIRVGKGKRVIRNGSIAGLITWA